MTLRLACLFACATLCCGPRVLASPASTGRMLQQLGQKDWILQAEALHYLAEEGVAEAVAPVRKILKDEHAPVWIRGRALLALAAIEKALQPGEFGSFVAHPDPVLRSAAAEVLESHGGTAGETWLAILLKDTDPAVRLRAAASHARRAGAKAWPIADPLTRTLDPRNIESAARALALVGSKPALERLANLARDDKMLSGTIRGMNGLTDPRLIPILFEILVDLDSTDRRFGAALTALQHHEWQELIAAMRVALEARREELTRTVANVMTLLARSPELGDPLQKALAGVEDVNTLRAGMIALGSRTMQPDRYKDFFATRLTHTDENIRTLAIRCLAHCESVNLWTKLEKSITDSEPLVIRVALEALLRAPVTQAPRGRLVQFLQGPLTSPDDELRDLAYKLLGHAGSEADYQPAFALLGSLLNGTNTELRVAAARALGQIAPLEKLGEIAVTQGFLANWMVIGTFLNDEENSGFSEKFPPEERIDFEATYLSKYVWIIDGRRKKEDEEAIEREIKWNEAVVDQTDGRLIMSAHVPPPGSLAVGYAVADFRVDGGGEVVLDIDGDDAFRVWLNGEEIAEKVAPFESRQPCVAEVRGQKVQLTDGVNRIVVKSANIDHQWWLRLRLTGPDGKPIKFSTP